MYDALKKPNCIIPMDNIGCLVKFMIFRGRNKTILFVFLIYRQDSSVRHNTGRPLFCKMQST